MIAFRSGYSLSSEMPQHNPCAQCGKPIAAPEWVEEDRRVTSYLWHCAACGYKFESMAFFKRARQDSGSLAA